MWCCVLLLLYSYSVSHDVYRHCASVVLLRPSGEVLLVHKPRKRDAWQLPQGGMEEGETVEEAGLRELREETGVVANILGRSDTVYQYDFPDSYRRFRPDTVCGQRIEFVFVQPMVDDPVVVVDTVEIDTYAWASIDSLSQYIQRKEYRKIVKKLIEEHLMGQRVQKAQR
jgi:8-oxo-dGTP pyrophosphatase MutT (NUDIX family)